MIIGITGGTGCGKTTALNILSRLGAVILDCDVIYHDLIKTDPVLLQAISQRFPGTVQNGMLNRKKLGTLVFSDENALKDLNRITHTAVKQEVLRRLTPEPALAAIDAIGLFESGLSELCQLTIAVTAPEESRISRLMARDGITEEYARARIRSQRSSESFSRLCDYTLENNTTEADFHSKCLAFFKELGIMGI